MRYFLKLAQNEAFEEVDKYTYDNYLAALADDGESNRYLPNCFALLHDDGSISLELIGSPVRDLAILGRALNADLPARDASGKGFVREPATIKFKRGKMIIMRELKTGEEWRKKIA
jgi:hypothetical protein